MLTIATPPPPLLPARRTGLVIRPLGEDGRYVVKDPTLAAYYHLGVEEHYLLLQLDGEKDAVAIRAAFEQRFGQPLGEEDLHEFIGMAHEQGFLQTGEATPVPRPKQVAGNDPTSAVTTRDEKPAEAQGRRQSILHWRKSLFDPDLFFTWLEPRIRFFWTPGFLVLSAGCILSAVFVVGANRHQLARSFALTLRWETAFWVWLTLFTVTMLHECAHGLTCKHHGGEVHEIGFLLLFFMPCFYCNVSDAWLFKEKSKRLWVTFAGGYLQLFLWALAVFVWRLATPDNPINYLSLVVLTACGVQTLFNFNPLLKLDGYYLLSDWMEVPNLQERSAQYVKSGMRWLFWGAVCPGREPRGRFLLLYGLASWLYSVLFLALMLWALFQVLWRAWGWLGAIGVLLLGFISTQGLFHGVSGGEIHNMIATRRKRTFFWFLSLGGLAAGLCLVEMDDRAGGSFRLRPVSRAELRAPVAGFLKEIYCEEGDRVSPGELVARLEVPDLESRRTQKQAEVREVQSRLRLLEIGSRPEEVAEQRQRVERSKTWRDLARQDLASSRQGFNEDLNWLEKHGAARRAELEAAQDAYNRSKALRARGAASVEECVDAEKKQQVCEARLEQAQAERRARRARGTLDAEAELARREKELADAQGVLTLLEAGVRPEEVEAERARLSRLREELRHLEEQQRKQAVTTPVTGLVTTTRLKEKVGQFLHEGEMIGVVEETGILVAEIVVAEQDISRVRVGQPVELKARGLPFETLKTQVDRIAPAAGQGEVQSTVTIYCPLSSHPDHPVAGVRHNRPDLRPEMTGYARVCTGRQPIGQILLERALRFLRTEFWW